MQINRIMDLEKNNITSIKSAVSLRKKIAANEQGLLFVDQNEYDEYSGGYSGKKRKEPLSVEDTFVCTNCKEVKDKDSLGAWAEGDAKQKGFFFKPEKQKEIIDSLAVMNSYIAKFTDFKNLLKSDLNDSRLKELIGDINKYLKQIKSNVVLEYIPNASKFIYIDKITSILNDLKYAMNVAQKSVKQIQTYNIQYKQPYCVECVLGKKKCSACEREFYTSKLSNFGYNVRLCNSCVSIYSVCDKCHKVILESKLQRVGGDEDGDEEKKYCDTCVATTEYKKCNNCGRYVKDQSKLENVSVYDTIGKVCSKCAPKYWTYSGMQKARDLATTIDKNDSYVPINGDLLKNVLIPKVLEPMIAKNEQLSFIDDRINKATTNMLDKREMKAFIKMVMKKAKTLNEILDFANTQVSYDKQKKEKYPALYGTMNIPYDISIANYTNKKKREAFVIGLSVKEQVLTYAKNVIGPKAESVYKKFISRNDIINNKDVFAWAVIGKTGGISPKFIVESLNSQMTDIVMDNKFNEEKMWWKDILSNWPVMLLAVVQEISKKLSIPTYLNSDKAINYLSDSESVGQPVKEYDIDPETKRDLYTKAPEILGLKKEEIMLTDALRDVSTADKFYRVASRKRLLMLNDYCIK